MLTGLAIVDGDGGRGRLHGQPLGDDGGSRLSGLAVELGFSGSMAVRYAKL